MNLMLIANRLAAQGLLSNSSDFLSALQRTAGIQAQAQREAELNLALRQENFTLSELTEAYQKAQVVKSWANRWTLHLLTSEDWVLWLAARGDEKLPKGYFGGQEAMVLHLADKLTELLKNQGSLNKSEVDAYISVTVPDFPSRLTYAVLQVLMARGVCFFDASYSSRDYLLRVPERLELPSKEEATQILMQRYLTGFGPVTLADFIKWSGLKISFCRPLWQEVVKNFESVKLDGVTYFANNFSSNLIEQMLGRTLIVARFDSLLTGYADKTWFTPEDKISEMWTSNGILNAPIIYGGKLVGKWRYILKNKQIDFEITAWDSFDKDQLKALFKRLANFLEQELDTTHMEKMNE